MKRKPDPQVLAIPLASFSTSIAEVKKLRTRLATLTLALGGIFATTAVLGQTTYVWTNQNPAHLAGSGDMNVAANWDPNGNPTPMVGPDANTNYGDLLLFDGKTTGPLSVTESGGTLGGYGGQSSPFGVRIVLTSNQTDSVTIFSVLAVSGGLRMNYFSCDPGSGGLMLGDGSLNCFDIIDGELNGQITGLTNNSSVPAVVTESVRWREGGAGAHPHVFAGTGDWIVRNHMRSANQSTILVQKFGPGTMTWIGTNVPNANYPDPIGSPITIGEGTMIWKTSNLVGGSAGNPGIVNDALWEYDADDGGSCTVLGTVSGTGVLQVNAGTLELSGANTFTGNLNLTGGTLIAGRAEIPGVSGPFGVSNVISFNGGVLEYSANNTFDYSSRFDTTPGQAYQIDTGNQNVTYGTGLGGTGTSLTKLGGGTLTLAGTNSYTGPTTISSGEVVFQGPKTGTADITVADGAALGVTEVSGTQATPSTLTLGTGLDATLDFNNVTNTTTAPLAATTLSAPGTVNIKVNSGVFDIVGQTFPLLTWTAGSAPVVNLASVAGGSGHLVTNLNTIQLVIDEPPFIWTGLNNNTWDTSTPNNWVQSDISVTFSDNVIAVFDDTTSRTNVTVSGEVRPASTTVTTINAYTLTTSAGNQLGGTNSLTKNGSGSLTVSGGANTYTGPTTLNGGILSVGVLANGGSPSDIGQSSSSEASLVLNGGTLQYTGAGAAIDRLFTVGTGGGTIDNQSSGALVFNNSGTIGIKGNGPRTLTLAGLGVGAANKLAAKVVDSSVGATALTKSGPGVWILTASNTYSGGTAIADGVLQIGEGGPSGSLGSGGVVDNASLVFNGTNSTTVGGVISGTGSVDNQGSGTVILANDSTYTGGTTISAGTLQVGNGGSKGSLYTSGAITISNNATLDFFTSGSSSYSGAGLISGTGNVIARGGGVIKVVGDNTYTGWTRIDSGTMFWPREGQDGDLLSSAITNNGIFRVVEQEAPGFTYAGPIVGSGRVEIGANNINVGQIIFTGTNTYSGGTFIGDNELILGDGFTPGAGSYDGNVQFVNNFTIGQDNPRTLTFNRPDDFTFSGNITTNFTTPQLNQGVVQQNGYGTLTLTGTNTYAGGTIINNGTVQVGNGGTSGSIGSGNVTATTGTLTFNRSDDFTFSGDITGSGGVVQEGTGTTTLLTNTFTGVTTVSNGTLIVNGDNASGYVSVHGGALGGTGTFTVGPVVMDAGTTLTPGPSAGAIGTLTFYGSLTFSGNVAIDVNKSLTQSNDFVSSPNGVFNSGTGTVTVANHGPALAVGDRFVLFDYAVNNGAALKVTGAGATWTNNLALDGSITALTVSAPPTATNITFSVSGNQLTLSWPGSHLGWILQAQTNSLADGLSGQWFDVAGSGSSTQQVITISPASPTVFYRLRSP